MIEKKNHQKRTRVKTAAVLVLFITMVECIEVNITPEMGDPLEVVIEGGASAKPVDETIELTASILNYQGTMDFEWFVNGSSAETGDTLLFDTSWPEGYYLIEVVVYISDGTRAGSASRGDGGCKPRL